jgi:glycosyltransferase involved in cell wall biosynthesis
VLEHAHDLLARSNLDYEIIVCDDGSTDATGRIIDEIAARYPDVRALHHRENQGIRRTFEHLYHEATREFVFLNSTDGQWDTSVLFDLLSQTREHDIVIATRREKHYRPFRAFVSWGFNALPPLLFGVSTYDAGAVKLVRREIIQRFELVSQSPFSEAERLIRAARAGYRITECPADTKPRQGGRSRGVNAQLVVQALQDVVRVWQTLRANAADQRSPQSNTVRESSHADRR